ncbi:MAG: beta-ketoacyl-[acyl-carrier-protein] synthase II [Candidatus Omnitrophica bacterium]|nr:beta-ketoacyl-[acyl-carrier-protein] synthase II [Candidatus Omnitrophota bacterium]
MSGLRPRVVITGMGAVTPLANDVQENWKKLCEGRSGVAAITLFDAGSFPTRIAGEVKNFPIAGILGRNSAFALGAAAEAVKDSGFEIKKMDPTRAGAYLGAGDGGFDFREHAAILAASFNAEQDSVDRKKFFEKSVARAHSKKLLEEEPSRVVYHLSERLGVEGPVSNCLTACAASSQAIGEAAEIIRRGSADVMITGGTHSMIHPMGLGGFNLLTALSVRNEEPARASRPFDKDRDGFVLAEGSGMVVLEELGHARKRGAKIYAELAGYGCTADAFRLTDPHPAGRGAIQAMSLALRDAGLSTDQIDYISAHGTSTQLNDQIETAAVKKVFPNAKNIPMSSIKSMLGHMIAAAGAIELIASVLTIRDGILPPTINYETPDENCDLDYVPNRARRQKVEAVLSNSFGFGGQNVSLIVKSFK